MTIKHLFSQFSQALYWNALSYSLYKVFFVARSFFLLQKLSPNYFALWANIMSIIFLLLLWIDFGFRKSIPHYLPQINDKKTFIYQILKLQLLLLSVATPIMAYLLYNLLINLITTPDKAVIFFGIIIFMLEGIITNLRLIYHANFKHKQFNATESIILLAQIITDLIIIQHCKGEYTILIGILLSHIIGGLLIIMLSKNLLKSCVIKMTNKKNDYPKLKKEFLKHSGVMWSTMLIKSITERNFLIPFVTYTMGTPIANIFKIANDASLIMYRVALKTIGTADTSLLTHAQQIGDTKQGIEIAFKRLSTLIAALCLPLLGIIGFIFYLGRNQWNSIIVFQLFYIMAISYIIEMYFIPYERYLEVEKRYNLLFYTYIPYIVILLLFIILSLNPTCIGIVNFACMVQGVRLVSSLSMMLLTGVHYNKINPLYGISEVAKSFTQAFRYITCVGSIIGISIGIRFLFPV